MPGWYPRELLGVGKNHTSGILGRVIKWWCIRLSGGVVRGSRTIRKILPQSGLKHDKGNGNSRKQRQRKNWSADPLREERWRPGLEHDKGGKYFRVLSTNLSLGDWKIVFILNSISSIHPSIHPSILSSNNIPWHHCIGLLHLMNRNKICFPKPFSLLSPLMCQNLCQILN